ncbi:MAG TPA: DNA primase [Steroidobacteraceae bacterium]|nr:DNA primase [Steroidobacteraceae bacterium]
MAGRIPRAFIDELLARTDIVEVIGSRVQLKKAGREWKANCPFHGEKTPSFTVSQQKQFYHCFGCGAHGTALSFLMEHDRLGFPEAVEELASRAGLEVPREGGGAADPRDRMQDDLFALTGNVDQHFRDALRDSERAKDYLKGRGLVGETAVRYHLGYAPPGWDGLLKTFGATEAGRQALLTAGLIIERSPDQQKSAGPGYYDRFRDRIMFPIRDSRGRVVGFGGRVIDAGEPKYLNSPETPLFHKGRELYGLYEARQQLRTIKQLLVVEGYMDVARLAQAGIYYAVATLGTATTPEHLNRMFRVTSDVVFCFDGDRAGREAAWRAVETCLPHAKEGRQIKFLFLPDGHDPDTLVAAEGREAFEARLEGALPLSEYLVSHLAADVDLASVDGRARLAELARPLVARVPDGIYRELLIERLAREVRMPAPRLAQHLALGDRAHTALGASPFAPASRSRGTARAAAAGRGSLVSQAIARVVQYPGAAQAIRDPQTLRNSGDRGLEVLAELIETAQSEPHLTAAQLVERWRERPEHARLAELAAWPLPELDEQAIGRELAGAVAKLIAEAGPEKRVDELIARAESSSLGEDEKRELTALQRRRRPPPRTPG